MKEIIKRRRNYSPQEVQDQEPYYWVVSLWAGDPEDGSAWLGVKDADGKPCRELPTKNYERATARAEYWLERGAGQYFVHIEQVVVRSLEVWVK